ncbi:MAG: helix-turn-helix transcriptional regulator [Clostridiales bacterium]|nr:helix-turn-helix transcriptional regulator [Clostridiales bacterium]
MKIRKKQYGDCNMVGEHIERLRKEKGIRQKDFIEKIQLAGYDMNPSSYSKLEGQLKVATDKELFAIAKVLNVTIDELFR